MYKVKFDNFRCFSSSPLLEIRPITFLVGENSAGKTSFLAGVRYILESLSRGNQNPFNRDPYFLGGFEQIAHYRGGRGGRAKKFSLAIEIPSTARRRHERRAGNQTTRHEFTFVKGYPQPLLETYGFQTGSTDISLSLDSPRPKLSIKGDIISFPNQESKLNRLPSSSLIQNDSYFLQYLFEDLMLSSDIIGKKLESSDSDESEQTVHARREIWESFRDSSRILSQDVFASAPVRTQPLRTYTPSELIASSEGSHVPLEFSRLKQRSPDEWSTIKAALEKFGKNSGLFTDIDIRHLGKSDIDPFQILVKTNGQAMNLVDVGYGVSQALPIIYQMQNSAKYNAFLLQQPEVHLHPRAQAEFGTLLSEMVARPQAPTMIVETHSDYIIDRVRIEIARGKISPDKVTILFFQRDQHGSTATNIFLNKQGDIQDAPEGYRSFFMEEHSRLLGL